MTALYAILAIICIGGILMGAYLIGFDDGVTAEQLRRVHEKEALQRGEDDGGDRHTLTHADLVQMEQEAINKQKEQ